MTRKSTLLAAAFVLAHIAFVAAFVPLASAASVTLGLLAMTSMALCLVLAARWRLVDVLLGGPDKSYHLHKWLGFFALAGTLGHWAIASDLGAGVVPMLTDSAEEVGTLAATGLIIMSAAAMVRAIPYHLWKVSHMLMGPVFAIAAFHAVFVSDPNAIGTAPWTFLAGVSGIGLVAWLRTIMRSLASDRLVKVKSVTPFEGGVDVTVHSDQDLDPFRPGQFANLGLDGDRSEAHPFSIAGGSARERRFIISAAGDWTRNFAKSVRPGDRLRLGQPEGRFLPQVGPRRTEQLWVAGGVGITPFLAALERMEPDTGPTVTLIYCIRSKPSAGALDDVLHHANRLPQVRLIVVNSQLGARLTQQHLTAVMRDMAADAQAYLCGPEGLKNLVTSCWRNAGMRGRIHGERFDFRGAYSLTELLSLGKPVSNMTRRLAVRAKGRADAASGT